jgi:hypothetical protein
VEKGCFLAFFRDFPSSGVQFHEHDESKHSIFEFKVHHIRCKHQDLQEKLSQLTFRRTGRIV